jgi:MioC protein
MNTPNQTGIYNLFRSAIAFSGDQLLSIFKSQSTRSKPKEKTHDYSQLEKGSDYIFESVDGGSRGYMTGQGGGVKCGDYVILPAESNGGRYQVKEIDYYSNPSDVWTALLERVDERHP